MTASTQTAANLDQLCINTIRTLSLDAVQKAESGHAGLPLGCAPMAYVLWTKFLKHNPKNPKWFNRDRFLLSAGHGSMLLYSLLHLTGYDLPLEEIKKFRQLHSKTPGHPENVLTAGVELTTGPLGQGFGNGVGMAIAQTHLAAKFNRDNFPVCEHFVYAIVSDGDLMEGVSQEAASLAGHLKLGKLIYLYDDNHITIDGGTDLAFTEDVVKRFDAYGWHTSRVADGNDTAAIEKAIKDAQAVTDKPSLIAIRTIIGFGMPKQGTSKAHSDAPGEDAVKETKRNLGWDENAQFLIPDEALNHFRQAVENGAQAEQDWEAMARQYDQIFVDLGKDFADIRKNELPANWEDALPKFDDVKAAGTRVYSGEVINALATVLPQLIGGSADLAPSNNTSIKDSHDFEPGKYDGRIMHFGVREHAMGAALNGMALYGSVIPYGGTFMCFSDYMRPAVRLAALSEIQAIFIFTHDSIGLGEDGPTHQPVEQLAALRVIPHLYTIRPADAHETREAWRIALKRNHAPTALIFSRQKVALIDQTKYNSATGTQKGAYILAEADGGAAKLILLATGSEVGLALQARERLQSEGTPTRVVSMPCWELFGEQDQAYRDEVLPPQITARLAIEAGVNFGWERWTGAHGDTVTQNRFGASGKGEEVLNFFGFNVENVVAKAKNLLK